MPESPGRITDSEALKRRTFRRFLSSFYDVLRRNAPFALSLTLILVVALSALTNFFRSSHAEKWKHHSLEVVATAQELRSNISDTQSSMRAFLITGVDSALDLYRTALPLASQNLQRLVTPHARQSEAGGSSRHDLDQLGCAHGLFAPAHRVAGTKRPAGIAIGRGRPGLRAAQPPISPTSKASSMRSNSCSPPARRLLTPMPATPISCSSRAGVWWWAFLSLPT